VSSALRPYLKASRRTERKKKSEKVRIWGSSGLGKMELVWGDYFLLLGIQQRFRNPKDTRNRSTDVSR